jgi:hypothetical protein
MFNNEKAIEEFEGQTGYGKEIHGDDCFAMVGKEGQPLFAWIAATSSQIPRYCALRDFETELQKLSLNSRRTPV